MQNEINQALCVSDEIIDINNWVMCYPYGSYNEETLDYLKKTGCSLGLTTAVAVAKLPADENLEIPRIDTNDLPPKRGNYKNIS
jgi:hypothetical protein